jgi:pSer/pThr/pTyr-binding forkhead associated (FHA) protein
MRDASLPVEGDAPADLRFTEPALPPDFRPLQLLLEPSGLVFSLTRANVLVGRHSEADVRLPLPDVSRRHCRFLFERGLWQVIDLNSLNGVFVNGKRVAQATLHPGDQVSLGGYTFVVEPPAAERTELRSAA